MTKRLIRYFSRGEALLWCCSATLILAAFCVFDRTRYMTLIASLIGVTAILFNAKGNPIGQLLMVIFSLLYGVISYSFSYYGEMMTYLGMTLPMAVFALIAWLRNPYQGNRSEVQVHALTRREGVLILLLSAVVTGAFYFILAYFHTPNLLPSTISVTTSFLAVALTLRRSPLFSLAYAANDVVLLILWALASAEDLRYLSVEVCFLAFLVNDLYGFFNWRSMQRRQAAAA